ncbi:MAG: bifunctional metallophosphatase/5'-nucleotidase [Clostridium sp.]|nr:bifunctional metallophosphatase/5'-nucleotidase [Clostridium sp.]
MNCSKKRRMLSLWLALLMTMSLAFGSSFAAFAADHDIVVLYTNDVHCGVDDNIGYAGLALYKQEMLQETPYVTLVDAGDAVQGAPIGTISDGGYIIEIMNKAGYDFAIPGNHEYDYGMGRFMELAGQLNCGYTSCNFMNLAAGTTVFEPYRMFTYGDTRVAYVGATTPESFTKSTPAYFQDSQGNYIYGFCEDESGQGLYNQIQATVDAAKGARADYVILVGHLGENGTTDRWSSDNIVKNTRGIDAVIDGHSHETVPGKTVKNADGKDVPLTQTGTKLKNIGKLTIRTDGTITTELVDNVPAQDTARDYMVQKNDSLSRIAARELGDQNRWIDIYNHNLNKLSNPNVLPVGLSIVIPGSCVVEDGKALDYGTNRLIKNIQAKYDETLKAVIGHTDADLTVNDAATGQRAVRSAETNMGDLAADAYRVMLGADIGLSNGGGVRTGIKAGNITFNDALAVFPFGNMGCVVEVKGQQIKDALEMASRNCPEENGGFLQVSGMTYTIDTSVKSSVTLDDKGNFTGVSGAYRVKDIMVGGQPLDPAATYTVASHNYMLKSGGDGMAMFKGSNVLKDEVMVDVDILAGYIKRLGGNVGAEYANPAGQGRITIQ